VIATYAAVLAVCAASILVGAAAVALCGRREWSWVSPAVGLALVCAVCWGTVRLSGHGLVSAILVPVLVIASAVYLRGRLLGAGEALRLGWPVALGALVATAIPFVVEGHFGILGTSFNPDMSQHLLTTARLAEGHGSQLLHQGYPLGPHSVVVALNKGLGIGFVQGFDGLSISVMVIAALTALAAFAQLGNLARTAGALVVGLAYVVASYFAQGAFKETLEALFLLAFVLSLRESGAAEWGGRELRFVPAALLAVGAAYTYSFPGLLWLGGAAAVWVLVSLATGRRLALRPLGLALLVFVVLVAPEVGRMVDFHKFETFDPNGPGLGNLFGQISPFEALGIWPSGDFRLAPGDGAVPMPAYHLGIAFALVLLVYGAVRCWRRRELAVLSGLAVALLAYAGARAAGTAYTAAKAVEIAAPLAALTILLPLLPEVNSRVSRGMRDKLDSRALPALAGVLFLAAAGVCSLLALANAPIGPTSYSPALTGLRPLIANDSTLVVASDTLLANEHGTPYISWELRGGRVCIQAESEVGGKPPTGVRFVVTRGSAGSPPFPGLRARRVAPPYLLWEATGPVAAKSPCPLIAVRQARQGPAR
jgi:hypothetical protein